MLWMSELPSPLAFCSIAFRLITLRFIAFPTGLLP